MEKVVYALWRDPGEPRERFNARVLDVAPRMAEACAALRLNLQDDAVAASRSPRLASTSPQMEAVVQAWVEAARDEVRKPLESLLATASARFAGWLACESTPLANTRHPPAPGRRTEGFSQIAFLGRPPRLTWEAWREIWQSSHTAVAIETQSTFEYVQNLIVRPLTYAAPSYAAIVEECFPPAAMTEESVYFDALEAPERLRAHQARMAESCASFIDFDRIDCIPTSQFEIKRLRP
jgi:hypothetical protein